jgi:hypothetical protein
MIAAPCQSILILLGVARFGGGTGERTFGMYRLDFEEFASA